MEIYGSKAGILLAFGGIEMAGNGFEGRKFSLTRSLFEGAETYAARGIGCENTVFAADNLSDKFPFGVDVGSAFLGNCALCGRGKEGEDFTEVLSDGLVFGGREGSARIAVDAALAETFLQVAAEKAFYEVEGNYGVADLKHN